VPDAVVITEQRIPTGLAASQIAIKQAGTNGGGITQGNSANPFENPTALTNVLENVLILLIPMALCFSFG
ncbi:potassium-transporting ATPase subunit KdpA, partial [Faecalibaculum rodentium]